MEFLSPQDQDVRFQKRFKQINAELLDFGWMFVGWMQGFEVKAIEALLLECARNPDQKPLEEINNLMSQHAFSPNVRAFTVKRLVEHPGTRRIAHYIEAATFNYYRHDFLSSMLCMLPAVEGILLGRMGWTTSSGEKPGFKAMKASLSTAVACSPPLSGRLEIHRDALIAFMDKWLYSQHASFDTSMSYLNRHYALHCMGNGCFYSAADCHRLFTFIDVFLDFLAYETGVGMSAFIPSPNEFIDARVGHYASLILGDCTVADARIIELGFLASNPGYTAEKNPPDWRKIVADRQRAEEALFANFRSTTGEDRSRGVPNSGPIRV